MKRVCAMWGMHRGDAQDATAACSHVNCSSLTEDHKAQLVRLVSRAPQFDEPMSRHTTIRVGGPADALVTVYTLDELRRVLEFAIEQQLSVFVLGAGSNIIVRDGGIRGIVLQLQGEFLNVNQNGTELIAGGGVLLRQLIETATNSGLRGLEPLVGVPGTLGGALISNAGTASEFIGDRVVSVAMVDECGELRVFNRDQLQFAYRSSNVADLGKVVVSVTLSMERAEQETIRKHICELYNLRCRTQPIGQPSAGCIFKNPPNECAGRLIDRAKLKGLRYGRAQVSEIHANFIINLGGASATEVLNLMDMVRRVVYEQFGVKLEDEVQVVGQD